MAKHALLHLQVSNKGVGVMSYNYTLRCLCVRIHRNIIPTHVPQPYSSYSGLHCLITPPPCQPNHSSYSNQTIAYSLYIYIYVCVCVCVSLFIYVYSPPPPPTPSCFSVKRSPKNEDPDPLNPKVLNPSPGTPPPFNPRALNTLQPYLESPL